MAYVTEEMIAGMAARFGAPYERSFHFDVTAKEVARIKSSQKDGRDHDVTLYVSHADRLLVMAKHIYPPGLYRAPSGGLKPGESFEHGIAREIAEELGCVIALDRFLLRTAVRFQHDNNWVDWRSFVFLAHYVEGDFNYTDHHEIREVAQVPWSDFAKFGRMMRATDLGGLHYRASLHETVVELLRSEGKTPVV